MKVKIISLPYISRFCMFCALLRPRYQVSVYRTISPLVYLLFLCFLKDLNMFILIHYDKRLILDNF